MVLHDAAHVECGLLEVGAANSTHGGSLGTEVERAVAVERVAQSAAQSVGAAPCLYVVLVVERRAALYSHEGVHVGDKTVANLRGDVDGSDMLAWRARADVEAEQKTVGERL